MLGRTKLQQDANTGCLSAHCHSSTVRPPIPSLTKISKETTHHTRSSSGHLLPSSSPASPQWRKKQRCKKDTYSLKLEATPVAGHVSSLTL